MRGNPILYAVAISLIAALFGACAPVISRGPEISQATTATVAEPPAPPSPPNVFIEVNIPATEMTLYENCIPLFRRRVAIGQGVYPTPVQESSIKKIEWNPWWYPPPAEWAKDEKVTPPGPGNPLGLVKMPLSQEILFHGTNKERSVGRPASHGCMRMFNSEVVEIAWYIQSHFSDKTDPALRELYQKNRRTTYVVNLHTPVPVRLVYRPVVARGGSLIFFPDYYNRLARRKKEAIIEELMHHGIEMGLIDDVKIEELAAHWPERGTEVPIAGLLIKAPPPGILNAPECN